jgi:hypothetical protein
MKLACKWIGTACVGVALLAGTAAVVAAAPQGAAAPGYTLPEYNAYQAEHNEQNPANKIKMADDFVAKYPMSTLMKYVYTDYYLAYYAQKNYAKTFEYVDKLLPLVDPTDLGTRLTALAARAQAYFAASGDKAFQTPDVVTKARDAAADGLKTLSAWQKPMGWTDDQFAMQKQKLGFVFDTVGGKTEGLLKNYKASADYYRAAIALQPMDAVSHYSLGAADLQDKPPNVNEGSWELARSIALKAPGDAQIKAYLKNQILNYQQASCDKLVDDQVNELLTLAAGSADRPATLMIPSADDLMKAREDTADFIPWLQEGGQHGKVMWLATCGLEYPDVGVKVLEVVPGDNDNVTLKVYRPMATDPAAATAEMEAATTPNMEVHVTGQPDAKKLMKDDQVRFTGTLSAYSQSPFMLTWDPAKVNADDLKDAAPAAGGAKKPGAARPAAPKK